MGKFWFLKYCILYVTFCTFLGSISLLDTFNDPSRQVTSLRFIKKLLLVTTLVRGAPTKLVSNHYRATQTAISSTGATFICSLLQGYSLRYYLPMQTNWIPIPFTPVTTAYTLLTCSKNAVQATRFTVKTARFCRSPTNTFTLLLTPKRTPLVAQRRGLSKELDERSSIYRDCSAVILSLHCNVWL